MTKAFYSVTLLFLAFLVGCAQLGLPVAQTFEEKLTAAVATVTAARDTATTLLNSKKITSDDAIHIQDQLRNARIGLDIARTTSKVDPAGADSKLTAIRAALTALQAYLVTKGG